MSKTMLQLYPGKYKSTFGCLKQLYVERGGLPAVWRGVLFPMTGFGVIFATAFGVYGSGIALVEETTGREAHLGHRMAAGAVAGFTSAVPRVVVERIKCYAQSTGVNSIKVVKHLYSGLGIFKGFFVVCFQLKFEKFLNFAYIILYTKLRYDFGTGSIKTGPFSIRFLAIWSKRRGEYVDTDISIRCD
eukprot:UN27237